MQEKKRIIILGTGFGGIYTYLSLKKHIKNLADVEIVLVDKKNYFLFTPMIHEVATGNLEHSSVIQPIRQIIDTKRAKFIEGEVSEINLDRREIKVNFSNHLENRTEIKYDYLVLAMGSENNLLNIPGLEHALVLKDLQDAERIRKRIIDAFEKANAVTDENTKKDLLKFVIIGGGPTGVELAGELADLAGRELKKAYPDLTKYCQIHLVHSGKQLIPQVDIWFHEKILKILKKMNVQVHLNSKVTEIMAEQVKCESGNIYCGNVFMAAGVKAREVSFVGQQKDLVKLETRSKRIGVTPYLNIADFENVFVVGDQACLQDKETGQPYPMRAQFAAREGSVAGENIARVINNSKKNIKLREFHWKDQGFIVSLGRGGALAQIYGIKFSGFLAWWLYRTAYLMKLVGTRAKLKTAYEWTINLFLPRNISKL